jgi:hypothetical protein
MAAFNMLIESIIESVCRVVVPLHQINVGMAIGSFVAFMFLKVCSAILPKHSIPRLSLGKQKNATIFLMYTLFN